MKKIIFSLFVLVCFFSYFTHTKWEDTYQLNTESLKEKTPHYVSLDEIPQDIIEAFIETEDSRFYDHIGIDAIGITRAIYRGITNGEMTEGGSTITQQVVKNEFLTQEQSVERKLKEMALALYIDSKYSKKEILEHYLNLIYFGEGAYGILNASQEYFGKSLSDLTIDEKAMLVGLPQAPSAYSPRVDINKTLARRNIVLEIMAREEIITKEELEEYKQKPIVIKEN